MPRIIRVRYHTDQLPEGTLSARGWLGLIDRGALVKMHEWAEPWPLLWTLSDLDVLDYVRRFHPTGPVAFLEISEEKACPVAGRRF